MTTRRDLLRFSVLGALMTRWPQLYAQTAGITPAQYAAMQAQNHPLPVQPGMRTPSIFVDAVNGDDNKDGSTPAKAFKTLAKLLTKTIGPGAVIGLANGSVFELTDRVAIKGWNGTANNRIYLTNYDPGGVPDTLPKVRYCFKPKASDWIWDASQSLWYFPHPNNRRFGYAYVRAGDRADWGISYSLAEDYAALRGATSLRYIATMGTPITGANRIYVSTPNGENPTTYYNGITIAGDEAGCLQFVRCGSYVTVENIQSEEAPNLLAVGVYNGAPNTDIVDFEMSNCHAVNVVSLMGTWADDLPQTIQVHVHHCSVQHYASCGVGLGNNSANCVIEGNWFYDGGKGCTSAGAVYIQERPSTTAQINGTKVRRNFVDTYANGLGDHPYDGAGIYCEINCNACVVQNNIVINCHTALQDNSGKSNFFIGNLLHCDRAIMITDGQAKSTHLVFDGNTVYSENNRTAYPSSGASSSSDAVIAWRAEVGQSQNYALYARGNVIRASGFSEKQAVFGFVSSSLPQLTLTGNTLSAGAPFGKRIYFTENVALPEAEGLQRLNLDGIVSTSYSSPDIARRGAYDIASPSDLLDQALSTGNQRGAIYGIAPA